MPDEDDMPLRERLRALRAQRSYSRSELSRRTAQVDPAGKGLPEITIKTLETRDRNQARVDTLELLSRALEVPPQTFPEYRLALARRLLDEREVGLRAALRNLAVLEERLTELPAEAPRPARRRTAAGRSHRSASGGGTPTPREE